MYDTEKDLLDALHAGPAMLEGLLARCTQEEAAEARGGDEGWSVVEVVCHLRDCEERAVERAVAMRDSDDPVLEGYDQDAWARERHYAADDLRRAFTAFCHYRAQHVAALGALSSAGWQRTGRHTEMGSITILGQAQHIAAHDAIHAAQIARQLGLATPHTSD